MTKALRSGLKRLHLADVAKITHVELTSAEALAILKHIEALEIALFR